MNHSGGGAGRKLIVAHAGKVLEKWDDFSFKRNELQFELLSLSPFAAFIKSISCVCGGIGGIGSVVVVVVVVVAVAVAVVTHAKFG